MNSFASLNKQSWQERSVRTYFLLVVTFWALAAVLLLVLGYEGSFLWLNRQRFPLADLVAPHLTHLGDGMLVLGLFGLFLVPLRAQWIWAMFSALMVILAIILLCKHYIFEEWDRPLLVFAGKEEFFYNSLSTLRVHAFPSGHSAAISGAVMVMVLAGRANPGWTGIAWAIGMILVAMTRLYIGVHFLGDVIAGTMVGTLIGYVVGGTIGLRLDRYLQEQTVRRQLSVQVSAAIFAIVSMSVGVILLMSRYYEL